MTARSDTMRLAAAAVFALSIFAARSAPAGDAQPSGDFRHEPPAEQQARTSLPLYFEYHGDSAVARVTVKYKGGQMSDWRRLELRRLGAGWGGLIPCGDVTSGVMRYYVVGIDQSGDAVASSGDPKQPYFVPIRQEISSEAPHLPGKPAPRQCAEGETGGDSSVDSESTTGTETPEKGEEATASGHAPGQNEVQDTSSKSASVEFAAYNDSDHVTVYTPSVRIGIDNVSGASLDGTYLVDVVSAASADIVSTASSRWEEVRQAGTLSAQYKPHDFGVSLGGSISSEPDYLSYGAYATVVKEFAEKNLTATFGYGFGHDTIGRCGAGGACTPFSVFSRTLQRGSFNAGLAWVVDRASLASLAMDVVIENGDQSKPYRYIPMFSPQIAPTVPKGASIDFVNTNRLPERPLEQLPLERHRLALTARYAHRLETSTIRLEERVYDDDWGLVASSTDGRWIFDLGRRFAVWPHVRFHGQTSVSFWQLAYVSGSATGWNLPEYRTGDRELGPLVTFEGGAGVRWYLGSSAEPEKLMLQLTADWMSTSFLNDLYLTSRTAMLGALGFQGQL
jgi:hypothetical protein